MSDVRVTGELRYFASSDEWEVSAYGGGNAAQGIPSFEVRLRRPTEEEAKEAFRTEWNERANTEWAEDEFAWEYNSVDGRPGDDQEG